jgi:acetyltransferase
VSKRAELSGRRVPAGEGLALDGLGLSGGEDTAIIMALEAARLQNPSGVRDGATEPADRNFAATRDDFVTVRNLEFLLNPKAIALVGASKVPSSVGAVLARNLFNGGFDGPVMPVNPSYRVIESVLTYPDIESLPVTPDVAVVSSPPDELPGIIAQLGVRGVRASVVVSAGVGEAPERRGRELQQAMLDAARPHLMRLLGPNSLGLMVPGIGLNASFSHIAPAPGRLAFVAQSGAIVTSVLDWAHARSIGFSHLVSLGDLADVDFGDMLDYLANDPSTQAILLYIEAVTNARKFMSAARAAARMKPVLVVKAGRHAEGARAVASHTGVLAGVDAVYDMVFRRAGMLRVFTLEELFDAVEILALVRMPRGERLAVITNGGGMGVLATDALIDRGGRLAELSGATSSALDRALPAGWSRSNPIDLLGDAAADRYAGAVQALKQDNGVDALLVIHCPTGVAAGTEAARAVVEISRGEGGPPVLTSWVGERAAVPARELFASSRIPTYETPEQAVRAFLYLVNYRRSQEMLTETPPSVPQDFSPEQATVQAAVGRALGEGRSWLTEPEAKDILAAYGVPVVPARTAQTPQGAAAIAAELGTAVALKILSPDITHKSDAGGVALDLYGSAAVRDAAASMLEHIRKEFPDARLEGFSVEPMIRRPGAYELMVGVTADPQFGPVLLFGHGGTAVEVVNDKALGLPPLNMHLAHEIMSRTRIYRLLRGYRAMAPARLDAIALTLIQVAQLAIDVAEIVELDVNPLLADEYGVVALDARIRVAAAVGPAADRLAIRPYPSELEETIALGDGRMLFLRPIRPEDEPSLQATFAKFTPDEIRQRFFVPMKTLSHVTAARFTQIDYDREMALILTEPGIAGKTDIYGVVGLNADPDNERAEYAIIVRGDMTGMGLGILLMRRIIDYARSRSIREIYGDVLHDNVTMLKLCRALGFSQSSLPDDPSIVRVTLRL